MKRRPTIPFFKWRIAVHLGRTKQIQNQPSMPAYKCQCELCSKWKCSYQEIIPSETLMELQRLGVQLEAPNELYGGQQNQGKYHVRAIYHIVGKIVSGPESTIFHDRLGEYVQNYVVIRSDPWFSVCVSNAKESCVLSPRIDNAKDGDIIVLDFRFDM
ncbi:hypothetical protein KSF73_13895 [Burkholderiaceae bacterium DAT-1]|nr:hypothetical protein [Burkholderiaceae bacterium DAT-1]